MSIEGYLLIASFIGLVLGIIGHLMPAEKSSVDQAKAKDSKIASAQDNWEGLQPKM